MSAWILIICISSTWAGCGGLEKVEFKTKQECFEVLDRIKISDKESSVAFCKPKEGGCKTIK